MAALPRRRDRGRPLRLACWTVDGVRGRKLELEHFLNQHGVDICLLSETFLHLGQVFRLANYVCHRTDRPTAGGGTAILVRRDIVHHSVPVPGLTHLETTAIQIMLAGRPVKGLPFTLSPTDRSAPGRFFWRWVTGLTGRRPERQTCGLELTTDHEKGKTPT
jgi:hypothetical protein